MSYTYDKIGNRKTQSALTMTGTTASTVSTAYSYDVADELLSQTVARAPPSKIPGTNPSAIHACSRSAFGRRVRVPRVEAWHPEGIEVLGVAR